MARSIEHRSAIGASARSPSPDEILMALCRETAEIIYANYPEDAHDLLAEMARHDVFAFLLDLAIEQDGDRNCSLRRAG